MSAPIPFKAAGNIPILGQVCTPLGCVHIVPMRCNCEAQTVITIEGTAAIAQCPACKRCYKIASANYDAATNEGTVTISSFMPEVAAQPPPSAKES